MIYLRDADPHNWPEIVCAESQMGFHDKEGRRPTAEKPDF
jgi:hypothetical protein